MNGRAEALDEVLDILPLSAVVAPPSPKAPACRKEELLPDVADLEYIDEQVIKVMYDYSLQLSCYICLCHQHYSFSELFFDTVMVLSLYYHRLASYQGNILLLSTAKLLYLSLLST